MSQWISSPVRTSETVIGKKVGPPIEVTGLVDPRNCKRISSHLRASIVAKHLQYSHFGRNGFVVVVDLRVVTDVFFKL